MRLPVELLTPHLGPILEGMLIWAEDSKNKFKLKVRGISMSICMGSSPQGKRHGFL